ncbi:hypothetical protein EU348_00885 [Chryseobacterium indologenes]|uniref:Uncharacterized protein n=1 Tax=Chryseobacterium indologenes TaxID=253 RepID=A0A411DHG0_CHRID|nr:hypothetical protein EU348_00885 [Chryseobacterium indologenes]
MKINNKKRVDHYMTVHLAALALLFLCIGILMYLEYILTLKIFSLMTLLVLVYGFLKNRFIFEYEHSGKMISIKSYQWPSNRGKSFVLETAQKKIVRIEIKEQTFRKYLILLFLNSSGRILRKNIDITFCSENEVNQLLKDISNNLMKGRTGTYFL